MIKKITEKPKSKNNLLSTTGPLPAVFEEERKPNRLKQKKSERDR